MKICFTRKEVLAMLRHMAEQEGESGGIVDLEINIESGFGMATYIIEDDGTEKDITDYSFW